MVKQRLLASTAPIASPSLLRKCPYRSAGGWPAGERSGREDHRTRRDGGGRAEAAPSPDMTVAQVGLYRNESDFTAPAQVALGRV